MSDINVTYRWLKRLRETPNSMWMTPRITDIFILKELRKVSLLVATFQICRKQDKYVTPPCLSSSEDNKYCSDVGTVLLNYLFVILV